MKPAESKYRHGEAFALMWYACECGHRERIWNSRDGVTPFGCTCPSCGKIMRHPDFKLDEHAPDHQLRRGQSFWRDGTADEAEAIMRRRIASMAKSYPCSPEKEAELVRNAREGSEGEFQKGWPMMDVHNA